MRALAMGLIAIFAACGGDDGGNKKTDAAIDSPRVRMDAAVDGPKVFMDAPPGTFPLTFKNYISWCNIAEGGGTEAHVDSITVNLLPGTYAVNASGFTGFEIEPGMWHHVDEDTGGTGADGTQSGGASGDSLAHVTITNAAKCIWVCCQFNTTHSGCGGLAEQCL